MALSSLNHYVVVSKSQALNTDRPIADIIACKHVVCSDADPEVLLYVAFSTSVQIKEIQVYADDAEHRPSHLIIQPGMLGFDQLRTSKAKLPLNYERNKAVAKLGPSLSRYDTNFTIMLPDNAGDDDQTAFGGIEFFGVANNALDTRGKTLNCKS